MRYGNKYISSLGDLPGSRQDVGDSRVVGANATTTRTISKRKPYPGIDRVMEYAADLVKRYTADERIRAKALEITRTVRKHAKTGQPDLRDRDAVASAIYNWMVRNINYVADPYDVERLQSPIVTLKQKAGDCDDHAILSAALLQSLGIHTGFRIVSRTGREFDHIYTVYRTSSGEWKSFDTTVLKYPGYAFNERLIKRSRHVPNNMPTTLKTTPNRKIVMNRSGYADQDITSSGEQLGFDPFTLATAGAGVIDKGAGIIGSIGKVTGIFGGGGSRCDSNKEAIRSQLEQSLQQYTTRAEREAFIKSTGTPTSEIQPTPSSMARFFIGGRDCLHKNVSPRHQRYLDNLGGWLSQKKKEKTQPSTSPSTAMTAGNSTMYVVAGVGVVAIVTGALAYVKTRNSNK